MGRRVFDHLFAELSVATGGSVPRFRLWLKFHDCGVDPERLSRATALAFCDGPLHDFLAAEGIDVSRRALRRLRRAVDLFDPNVPMPHERFS